MRNEKDALLKNIEKIFKGCNRGMSEKLIPHFLITYTDDGIQARERAYSFACDIQKKATEHERLGLSKNRVLPVFSLVLDRYIGQGELRSMLQKSQDISNRVGLNHYTGYMLFYIGSNTFESSELCGKNELLDFLIYDLLLKYSESIRGVFVVHDRIGERMNTLLGHELLSPVMKCPELFDTADIGGLMTKEELFVAFKESAGKCGVRMKTSSDDIAKLYDAVPKCFRNREEISRMVCGIILRGKTISVNNVREFIAREHAADKAGTPRAIGFRI